MTEPIANKAINIGKIYSRLEEFWNTDKYTDVTIICAEDKHFKCHRLILAAACKYFDAMFIEGRFLDSSSESITLPEMSADGFEQVVQFIYTGDARIDSKNVVSVLQASEFLELPGIEDLCVQFLKANGLTAQDTLNIFMFASATGKESLVDLLGRQVVNHFEVFSKIDSFLEIPVTDLRKILAHFTRASARKEDALLSAMARWINHNREERLQYFHEFVQVINFENISATYIQYMFTKFFLDTHLQTALTQTLKPVGYSEDSVFQMSATSPTEKLMHVFVKHAEENLMKVYSVNSSAQICSVSENPILLNHPSQWVRNVALDDFHLYRLNYINANQRPSAENWFLEQSFYAYTSVNTSLGLKLKPPPVNFNSTLVDLCALKNNIYLYYPLEPYTANLTNTYNFLNKEEINRGMCVYNCEVDDWFPVPKMRQQIGVACITSLNNNILYIIGAKLGSNLVDRRHAEMYDCREGIWQELPKTHHIYVCGTCCSLNGLVYVYSGCTSMTKFERFDPVAGRWEVMGSRLMPKRIYSQQMIAYSDELFVVGGLLVSDSSAFNALSYRKDLSMDILNLESGNWRESSVLSNASSSRTGVIVDVVNF